MDLHTRSGEDAGHYGKAGKGGQGNEHGMRLRLGACLNTVRKSVLGVWTFLHPTLSLADP